MKSEENQIVKVQEQTALIKPQQILATWMLSLKGDMEANVGEISLVKGLAEPRLYQLEKTCEKKEIIAVIVLQINDLLSFLGMQDKMTARNIFDTAELILESHPNISIKLIADCFKMVKKNEVPYNEPMYNSISGKKILDWISKYESIIENHLFGEAQSKIYRDKMRVSGKNTTQEKLINMAGGLRSLRENIVDRGLKEAVDNYNEIKK